jgi:hypothetical protein
MTEEEYPDYLAALEGDLYGVVGSAALANGVNVTEQQSLAIAHAVMRYMGALENPAAEQSRTA